MKRDMTTGTEWKVILSFTLPIMGASLLQTCYTLTDSIIVGNYIGPTALGAVGVSNAMTWLLLTVATGIGTGTSIACSQYFGAKRQEDIHRTASTAMLLAAGIGLAVTLLCFLFAKPLLWVFLDTPDEMKTDSYLYFVIYGCGIIFQMLYNVIYGILRAHGDSKGSLVFLLVAAILNVALDLLFVIVFGWGVTGAAVATVIAQAGSAAASAIYMWMLYPQMRFKGNKWIFDTEKLRIILKLGIPIILQTAVMAAGFIVLQRLVNSFGAPSIEGYTAMQRVESLIHIPSNSFNAAMSSFVGQNIGARKFDRIRKGYRSTIYMGGTICAVLVVLMLIFDETLLGFFNITDAALVRGVEHLDILVCFMIVSTVNNITVGLLQGAGDVKIPAVAGFVNLTVRLLTAYAMAGTVIDFRSIYYSLPPAWTIACLITAARYRSGKWRSKAI